MGQVSSLEKNSFLVAWRRQCHHGVGRGASGGCDTVELREWLAVYQATGATVSGKERALWSLWSAFLLASCLVAAGFAFVALGRWGTNGCLLTSGLAALGVVVALCWLVVPATLRAEVRYWQGLLREIEGMFAGAEFHRGAYRLQRGMEVRTPATSLHCDEWYPQIARLGRMRRWTTAAAAVALPLAFVIGWALVGIAPWVL